MAQLCRLPKDSRNTVINAIIRDISNTIDSQVPSHHVQQKRLLELKAKLERIMGLHRRELHYKQRKWISVY